MVSHHPIPDDNVKVPFQGKNIEKNILKVFYDFVLKKLKNGTEIITSCSIRRVGRSQLERQSQREPAEPIGALAVPPAWASGAKWSAGGVKWNAGGARLSAQGSNDGCSKSKIHERNVLWEQLSNATRRIPHDVIILVPFSIFIKNHKNDLTNILFYIFSPGRELWMTVEPNIEKIYIWKK